MLASLPKVHDTVVHMLVAAADAAPDHPAVIDGARQLTYRQLLRCVGGFASVLSDLGARYKRVALVLGNSIDMAIAMYAVHAAGAQAVPLNPIYTARELRQILDDAAPHIVLTDTTSHATVHPLCRELAIAEQIAVGPGGRSLDGWRDAGDCDLPRPWPRPDEWAALQYTGGTTGRAKGVMSTHRQMSFNVSQREGLLPTIPGEERILCIMPLFHCFAVAMCLHLSAYARSTLVILPRYHPRDVVEAIREHRITTFPAGPTVFTGLMSYEGLARGDLSSLRICYSGSAPLAAGTLKAWHEQTGCRILEGYGQTEAGPVITYNPTAREAKPGAVGIPVPGAEVEIVDVETGYHALETGERGEIRVRSPSVMSGYYNRPEETAAALRNGWLYTGDIGEFDSDGYLYIRDRKKDMAIVGGYNVYTREIDEVLYAHPAVLEAAAVGVPDAYRGEVIKAYVVTKPGARADIETILTHCRNNLAKYKIPAAIEFVASLPKTAVGKIDKKTLRGSGST
jgi:long-chain acyl-CoA synthetase